MPPERTSSLFLGIFIHLGPAAALVAIASATRFAIVPFVVAYLVVTVAGVLLTLWVEQRDPSVALAPVSTREVMDGIAVIALKGAVLGTGVVVGGWWLLSKLAFPWRTEGWLPIVIAVPLTDLAYYLGHRFLNHGKRARSIMGPIVRWYRRSHAPHHAVGALDFLRGNVSSAIDTGVTSFQIPLAIIAVLLGMDLASTLVAYALVLTLQGTHHVNHTFDIGVLRYLFVDNHNHKLHHCPRGNLVNFGAIFSVWDRLFGTYYEDRSLSPSYMEKHGIGLPVRPAERATAGAVHA
ncbi:Sterol desaturase [Minicystis rosea]|nr:Sterol desaturase [Minicystis rosea]